MTIDEVWFALQNRLTRACLFVQWLILAALVVLVVVFRQFEKIVHLVRDSNTTVLESVLNGTLRQSER